MRVTAGNRAATNPRPADGRSVAYLYTYLEPSRRQIRGDLLAIRGVVISDTARAVLAGYLNGAIRVVLGDLTADDYTRICEEPDLMRFALTREKNELTIGRPPQPEEMPGLIRREFAANPSVDLKMLTGLKKYLPQDEIGSLLRDQLAAITGPFTAEEVNAEGFAGLLDCLVELGDHGLIRAFLKEFTRSNPNSLSWQETNLQYFREKFPNERHYHEEDGDFNFGMGSFERAREAYLQAQLLSPDNAAVNKKIRNTDRALGRESVMRGEELRRSVGELWKQCAAGDQGVAVTLCQLACREADAFFKLFGSDEPFLRDASVNLAVLDALERAAASAEPEPLTGMAERLRQMGHGLVSDTLERLAGRKAMNPGRVKLIEQLLKDKAIEQIEPKLLAKLAEEGEDPTNRYQELCTAVYVEVFAEKHYEEADRLFVAGRLDEALAELALCLRVNPHDKHARHNSVCMLTELAKVGCAAAKRAAAQEYAAELAGNGFPSLSAELVGSLPPQLLIPRDQPLLRLIVNQSLTTAEGQQK